jgi:hypothetical protein
MTMKKKIYFPWIKRRVELTNKGRFDQSHKELYDMMGEIQALVLAKKGVDCSQQNDAIKNKMPPFCAAMKEHLKEEEESTPPVLREHCTREEETPIINKVGQAGGLGDARTLFPAIKMAMDEWCTREFCVKFMQLAPPPIRHLVVRSYIPDYETNVIPMRNAPTLSSKPDLSRVPCCGIPCCFPCIM